MTCLQICKIRCICIKVRSKKQETFDKICSVIFFILSLDIYLLRLCYKSLNVFFANSLTCCQMKRRLINSAKATCIPYPVKFLKTSISTNPCRVKSPNPGFKFNPRTNSVPQTPISANLVLNRGLDLTHLAGWINSLFDQFAKAIETLSFPFLKE